MRWLLLFGVFLSLHAEVTLIAHRGCSSLAPENTLTSFREAINLGADYIELDVHLTKDGHPVVVHDYLLCRTTGWDYSMPISDLTLDEVRLIDAGSWFGERFAKEQIPLLRDVLELPLKETGIMIEIKKESAPPRKIAVAVWRTIKEKLPKKILIGSDSAEILAHIKKIAPHMGIISIIGNQEALLEHASLHANAYAIWHKLLTKEWLEECKRKEQLVWVWTVNEKSDIAIALSLGVDGLITNLPLFAERERLEKP